METEETRSRRRRTILCVSAACLILVVAGVILAMTLGESDQAGVIYELSQKFS